MMRNVTFCKYDSMVSQPPHCPDDWFNWTSSSPQGVLQGVPLSLIHGAWRRVCGRAQQGEIRGLRRTTAQSERSALLAAARGGSSSAGPGQLQCGRPSSPALPRVPPPRETTGRASPSLRRPSVGLRSRGGGGAGGAGGWPAGHPPGLAASRGFPRADACDGGAPFGFCRAVGACGGGGGGPPLRACAPSGGGMCLRVCCTSRGGRRRQSCVGRNRTPGRTRTACTPEPLAHPTSTTTAGPIT